MTKIMAKVSSGLYIPEKVLKKAGIHDDVEIDLREQEIRILPAGKKYTPKKISRTSVFWDCVGSAEIPGINGRDHDRYLYEK